MGAKKKRKKIEKRREKVAAKVDRWIEESDLTPEELMLAGIGVMARAVDDGKKKAFKRALRRGKKLASVGVASLDRLTAAPEPETVAEPVISYRPRGGGWYSVEVGNVAVESVKGEEQAATRAAELLQAYAALDPDDQAERTTELTHSGGGWYDIRVLGVPVDRVRGKDAAEERFAEIAAA